MKFRSLLCSSSRIVSRPAPYQHGVGCSYRRPAGFLAKTSGPFLSKNDLPQTTGAANNSAPGPSFSAMFVGAGAYALPAFTSASTRWYSSAAFLPALLV